MKIIPLGFEGRQSGFTHKIIVSYTDIQTAALTKTLQLFPDGTGTFPAGTIVSRVGFKLITPFDGGATSSLTVQLGDGGSTNRFLAATQIHEDDTQVYWAIGATHYVYDAADGLDALFTAVGANTAALTTGEIHIFIELVDMARADVPA